MGPVLSNSVRTRPSAPVLAVVAAALLAAGCGGGGSNTPATSATSATVDEPTTTSTTIDPALRDLLLVAADVPEFKEKESSEPKPEGDDPLTSCTAELPAPAALDGAPQVTGDTFVRGAQDAVLTSSKVVATTADKATALLDQLLEERATTCLEPVFRSAAEKTAEGSDVTTKVTATKSSVAGADQTVLVSATSTVKTSAASRDVRNDMVFLRRGGEIITVFYSGPTNLTSVQERQRIVAAISKKLGGGTSGTSTTSGSSTSMAGGGTSTTRRATTTTRRATTTTARATTTSSSTP